MHAGEYQMLFAVDAAALVDGMFSPQQKDDGWSLLTHFEDDVVCELLPSLLGMGSWRMGTYGQGRVEKKDALLSPSH